MHVQFAVSASALTPALQPPTFVRDAVHEDCPEVEQTITSSQVGLQHKGILCGMAAFKEHCTFGFWKHDLVVDAATDEMPQRRLAQGVEWMAHGKPDWKHT